MFRTFQFGVGFIIIFSKICSINIRKISEIMADIEEKQIDELDFDFSAKKKKKKQKKEDGVADKVEEKEQVPEPVVDEAPVEKTSQKEPVEAVDDLLDDSFSGKKKKKKKTTDGLSESTGKSEEKEEKTESETPDGNDFDSSFTGLKKKKKVDQADLTEFENQLKQQTEEEGAEDDKPALREDADDSDIKFDPTTQTEDPWAGSDRDYTYKEILDRAFRIIRQANPDSESGKKRYTMIPPQVVREGTKKTLFTNIAEICKRMHRPPEHVNAFLFSELGTTGSVDGRGMLVIKGRFQSPQIENVLRSYILEYVTCKICKSPDTLLTKENRLTFMQCQTCGAKRSVVSIKSGFSAQVDRRNKPQ